MGYSGVTHPSNEQIEAVAASIAEADKMPLADRAAVIAAACDGTDGLVVDPKIEAEVVVNLEWERETS